ncbi:hypothetical protein K469DRAFT_145940 [Zopfia rhizophila CBS 207.26]|uniref:Uncharacterized protein n=1 Tax=Zopfia rhizophila CBS 207.26 TaxID=1314779 RepID=A0A6A6E4P5_9PEZI|nr:hypothetical protein K469DRAFT_145940 [Zopfia rhizophila CBS 207.26]
MDPTNFQSRLFKPSRARLVRLPGYVRNDEACNEPSRLDLVINMNPTSYVYHYYDDQGMWRSVCKRADAWKHMKRILAPISRLCGLKDCFIYFRSNDDDILTARIFHEQRFERAIMGLAYDSNKRDKPQERFQHYHDLYGQELLDIGNWTEGGVETCFRR